MILCVPLRLQKACQRRGGGMDGDGKRKKIEHGFEGLVALGVKTVDVNPIRRSCAEIIYTAKRIYNQKTEFNVNVK